MAHVYRREDRGGAWYMQFRRNGRRFHGFVGPATMSRKDAEDILANKRIQVRKDEVYGPPPEPEPEVLFADFADDFLKTDSPDKKSKARDQQVIDMLKVEWKGLTIGQVTTKMIEDFKAKRLKNRAKATVARDFQTVKRLFRKAHEWGKAKSNPAETVKKPIAKNNRVRFLEPAELARIVEALPEWLSPVARFAHLTGARRGEALNLTWNDVDFKRGLLTFRETKNGDIGYVHLNDTTADLLKSLPAPVDRSQSVFRLANTPAVWMQINRAWDAALGTAKVTDFRFHDLRHQAATDLLTLGATLNDVRDFLRHKSAAMTLRYAHLVEDRRKSTACLLDQLGKASPKTTPKSVTR
ncbi:MAG: tyrosine-type recombinase/integrase [Candidatus Polarisedimenticolia bacterium]